jgi:hypothetical protein
MESRMEAVLKPVRELGELRPEIPQFLFSDSIWFPSSLALRKEVLKHKKKSPNDTEIDFVLNSPGGFPGDAYRIIRALRTDFKIVNIIVPFWAKSAATLLSLGASKLIVNDWAEFGPIDIQVPKPRPDSPKPDYESALNDEFSLKLLEGRAQELFKKMFIDYHQSENIPIEQNSLSCHLMQYLPNFYKPLLDQLNPYKLGEKKRSLEISVKYAKRILAQYNSLTTEEASSLTDYLVHECPDHGYNVDYTLLSVFLPNIVLAKKIGPEYDAKLDELSMHFMDSKEPDEYIGFVYGAKPATPAGAVPATTKITTASASEIEDSNGQKEADGSKPIQPVPAHARVSN